MAFFISCDKSYKFCFIVSVVWVQFGAINNTVWLIWHELIVIKHKTFFLLFQKWLAMSLNKTHPDLEPLIESSNAPAGKNSRWRFNKKVKLAGLILRRRDPKSQEKCGRVRLLAILCAFAFLLIYLSNLKPYQNMMIVRIPEDDSGVPGPRGICNHSNLLFNLLCYALFAPFYH